MTQNTIERTNEKFLDRYIHLGNKHILLDICNPWTVEMKECKKYFTYEVLENIFRNGQQKIYLFVSLNALAEYKPGSYDIKIRNNFFNNLLDFLQKAKDLDPDNSCKIYICIPKFRKNKRLFPSLEMTNNMSNDIRHEEYKGLINKINENTAKWSRVHDSRVIIFDDQITFKEYYSKEGYVEYTIAHYLLYGSANYIYKALLTVSNTTKGWDKLMYK